MATIPTQAIPVTGLDPVYNNASAGGDRVAPGSIIHVLNTNVAALNVTFDIVAVVDGDLAVPDRVISGIPANTGKRFLRVPNNSIYADPADGLVKITWSVTSGVTFTVVAAS
jgi:hypothetical protein